MLPKKWNGFFTVEAAGVVPVVLFLYLAILQAGLFLYNRCLLSQDSFLLGLRGSRYTYAEEGYGEVIYGQERQIMFRPENYVEERMQRRSAFYPGARWKIFACVIGKERTIIRYQMENAKEAAEKTVEAVNPVKRIREGRKE